jgi:hypothetical protein
MTSVPKKYRSQPDVFLIPSHEYDPSIHEIEYRYVQPTVDAQGQPMDPNAFVAGNVTDDSRFVPVPLPVPHPGPYPYPYGRPRRPRRPHPPYYGGYPYGGGYPYYGGHPGGYPYGGGYGGHPYGGYGGYPYGIGSPSRPR